MLNEEKKWGEIKLEALNLKARRDGHKRLPAVKRVFRALTGLTDEELSKRPKLDEELTPFCASFCEESPSDSFKVSASCSYLSSDPEALPVTAIL